MIPKEVLKNIRRIQITTSRMVTDVFAGQYQSVFKGRGIEFDEVRQYQPGDEIRSIDWNVTARMNLPYVKKFVEERELTIMILLDMSYSSRFGTARYFKNKLAAELSALFAFSAIKNNDKVGLVVFTDKIEKFVPPRKGLRHVLRVIREALYLNPKSKGTDITAALEYLNKISHRRTVAFIISDFYLPLQDTAESYTDDFKKSLAIANKRHDIIAVTITDPREFDMPDVGIARLNDAETGRSYLIDTSDTLLRRQYNENSLKRFKERARLFSSVNIDNIDIRTDIPYLKSLVAFFKKRERRMR